MDDFYTFDESGARRIVSAVRRVEGLPIGRGIGGDTPTDCRPTSFLAQTTDLVVAQNKSTNWAIFAGTTWASEAKTSSTGIKGYVRKGVVYPNVTYRLHGVGGLLEVSDPTLSGIGKTSGAITKGTSGTVKIYKGTLGSETDSGSTLTAWNRYADVADAKWVRWAWNDDSKAFDLVAAEC